MINCKSFKGVRQVCPCSVLLEPGVGNLRIVIVVHAAFVTLVVCALDDLDLPTRAVDGLEPAGLTLVFV